MSVDFYNVQGWIESGRPLDRTFVIVRRGKTFTTTDITQDEFELEVEMACTRIIHAVKGHAQDFDVEYSLEPDTEYEKYVIRQNYFTHNFNNLTFSIVLNCTQNAICPEARAVVTLHSREGGT